MTPHRYTPGSLKAVEDALAALSGELTNDAQVDWLNHALERLDEMERPASEAEKER